MDFLPYIRTNYTIAFLLHQHAFAHCAMWHILGTPFTQLLPNRVCFTNAGINNKKYIRREINAHIETKLTTADFFKQSSEKVYCFF